MNSRAVRKIAVVHFLRTRSLNSCEASISLVLFMSSLRLENEDLILDLELTAALGVVAVDFRIGKLQVRVVAVDPVVEPELQAPLVQQGGEVEVLARPLEVGHQLEGAEVEAGLDHRVFLLGDRLDEDLAVHGVVVALHGEADAAGERLVPEEVEAIVLVGRAAAAREIAALAVEADADRQCLRLAPRGAAVEIGGLRAEDVVREAPRVAEGVRVVDAAQSLEDAGAVFEVIVEDIAAGLRAVIPAGARGGGRRLEESVRAVVDGHQAGGRLEMVVGL